VRTIWTPADRVAFSTELEGRTGRSGRARHIDARQDSGDPRVPRRWEGDLMIGAHGESAADTLVEGTTIVIVIPALPEHEDSAPLADTPTRHSDAPSRRSAHADGLGSGLRDGHIGRPGADRGGRGPLRPLSSLDRGSNETPPIPRGPRGATTIVLPCEYLPQGSKIQNHHPHPTAISEAPSD
jgi:IS30 family transposase